MSEIYKYKAFGLTIGSQFPIVQLPPFYEDGSLDVEIISRDLSEFEVADGHFRIKKEELCFAIENVGKFHVVNGRLIEVHPLSDCTETVLAVYLMGSCMGAILHQRGFMPLHGSCITDGERAVLITGDSGAGKSTLAAEFLSHGWRFLTDDVAPVYDIDKVPMVQASYPSQKLWQDSLKQYGCTQEDIHSLYFRENREKFGVNVSEYYYDGSCPLCLVVRLIPLDKACAIEKMDGLTAVDQLMNNTYRSFMIAPDDRERHFRRCVNLAAEVPMAYIIRQNGIQCADTLYKMIVDYLKENKDE